jgi:hypothetical protein
MVGAVDRSEVMRSVRSGRRFRYRPVGKPIHRSSVFGVFIGQIKKIGHLGHFDEFLWRVNLLIAFFKTFR